MLYHHGSTGKNRTIYIKMSLERLELNAPQLKGIQCSRTAKATTEDILLLIAQGKSRREIETELGISKAIYSSQTTLT